MEAEPLAGQASVLPECVPREDLPASGGGRNGAGGTLLPCELAGMLLYRLLTALIGIPVILAAIWFGGYVFAGLVALLALIGLHEFYRLSARLGARPAGEVGYLIGLAFLLSAQAKSALSFPHEILALGLTALLIIAALGWEIQRRREAPTLLSAGATVAGCLYVPFLFSFLILIRGGFEAATEPVAPLALSGWDFGGRLVLLLFLVSWATDTAAYFVGRGLGRHKLAPSISPGKTIEGSVGGLIGAAIIGGIFGRAFGLSLVHALLLSAAMGAFGQVGDLAKSRLKREAGVKDFGALFPGHGGVLDRFDSLLFNAPLAYYYLSVLMPAACAPWPL